MRALQSTTGMRPFAAASTRTRSRLPSCRSRPLRVRVAAALDPDNTSIVVAGEGRLAIDITRKLKDMGSWVYVLQSEETYRSEIEKMMAFVVKGSAGNKAEVDKVFAGIEDVEGVVTTFGDATNEANANIIDAAVKKGAQKIVVVAADSKAAEDKLKASGVPYAIVSSTDDQVGQAVKSLFS